VLGTPEDQNLFAGNEGDAILVDGQTANVILTGNLIGLIPEGDDLQPAPNGGSGVKVDRATFVAIGTEECPAPCNTIGANEKGSVVVDQTLGVQIAGNLLVGNLPDGDPTPCVDIGPDVAGAFIGPEIPPDAPSRAR